MDPVTMMLIGAGVGGFSGWLKNQEEQAQRKQDLRANAIEAEYSWILDPAYRDVTRPGSAQGAVLGGALAGGMQGAMLSNVFGKGTGVGGEGELLMDPSAKAGQLASNKILAADAAPTAAWESQLSPGLRTENLGTPLQPVPNAWLTPQRAPNALAQPAMYQPGMQQPGMQQLPTLQPPNNLRPVRVPSYWGF